MFSNVHVSSGCHDVLIQHTIMSVANTQILDSHVPCQVLPIRVFYLKPASFNRL